MPSPTKSFAELQVTSSRKRGDTTSLLPSSYDPDTDVMPELPIPEASPSLYTRERLQQSLVYAERCLKRRDISPRSELFMQLYKEELKDALKAETMEQRDNHAMMVMAEERLIQDKGFLRPLKSAHRAELEDQLLQLRELQYLKRYGDYMKIVPTRLRLHASKHKSENWQLFSGNNYWSRIAVTLGAEEDARKEAVRIGAALDKVKLPTTATVCMACADLGISEELALWSIQEYGTRNREVHRDLNDLKRAGDFPLLASILCADRNELSSTFSLIKSETDITHLRAIIQSEIDEWFEDTNDNPNYPAAWAPSIALRQFHKDAVQKANQPSKDEIKQANIARSQRRSEEKVARQKEASAGTSSLAGKKRIASTEEPRGSERERQERTRLQRFKVLSQKCKLEDDMKRINRELALLDENDTSLDEQGSEDYIP
ncbi:MAG: hypothetical protein FRX48_06548 [Lasallia pustulata]|uniref:Uncharacterized protein n=1 Tax=Lasallia pustulata TaxID=136370 RepID=A0A5M8PLW4_9LECA|nr:MAG: hypothetical protein FRX48_06548 [Lasallia pustulata]